MKHTDGNIMPILDMIVESGIDALNPIEPAAGMDIGYLKEHYGDRVALVGNIDCGHLLCEAPVKEVCRVTRETIKVAAPRRRLPLGQLQQHPFVCEAREFPRHGGNLTATAITPWMSELAAGLHPAASARGQPSPAQYRIAATFALPGGLPSEPSRTDTCRASIPRNPIAFPSIWEDQLPRRSTWGPTGI